MSYPKEITARGQEILNARREETAQRLAAKRRQIARELPEAMRLEQEIGATSAKLARAVLSGSDTERKVAQIRAYNEQAQAKLSQLLAAHGYSAGDLLPQPQCKLCGDTGFTGGKRCECYERILKNLMYERLGASSQIEQYSFESFQLEYYPMGQDGHSGRSPRQVMSDNLSRCLAYAQHFTLTSPSLLMTGAPGLGKTHLSLSIASAVVEKGYDVLYTPFHTLLQKLEAVRFSHANDDYSGYIGAPLSCELLILDDVGAEFTTAFTVSVLYELINSRQITGKPTILNTNLDLRALEQRYSSRVTSRILGGYLVLPFIGNDIRLLTTPNR